MAASTYEEYFIRCPETQELVACRIEEFKSLLETMSAENALNQMDVPLYARDRFLHPNYVRFNMENREVIEGLKSVDAADIVPSQKRSRSPPVFSGCYDENVVLESKQLSDKSETQAPLSRVGVPLPLLEKTTLPLNSTAVTENIPVADLLAPMPVGPMPVGPMPVGLAKPIQQEEGTLRGQKVAPFKVENQIGEGMAIITEATGFIEPNYVGIPTYNPDPTIMQEEIYVGAGRKVVVLGGRTYLAC